MKVITQLIRHFWERGVFSADEVEYLLRHGFARAQDVPGFQRATVAESAPLLTDDSLPPEPPSELELFEESLVRRHSGRRLNHEPHAAELKIDQILERIRSELARRRSEFKSVLAMAHSTPQIKTWEHAVSSLRAMSADRFYAELHQGLKDGRVSLNELWQASEVEPFHRLLADDEVHGQSARAFLALLVMEHPGQLGKYGWILRYDEVQTLINLRIVYERLLMCLSRVYADDRHLLTRALDGNRDIVQVWSLLLLYNAHRDPQSGSAPDYKMEYGPVTLPRESVWKMAWTCALRMDRTVVSQFLIACYDECYPTELESDETCRRAMMCPVGWHIPDDSSSPIGN